MCLNINDNVQDSEIARSLPGFITHSTQKWVFSEMLFPADCLAWY